MGERPSHKIRLQPGARLGSYTITRCIGEGGMGVVYEGVHESLGKRVAIKTLHGAHGPDSDELVERFVREGKAAAKIQHPNVVDVFDVAVHDSTPYLVMEYLEGQDLAAKMEHEAPIAPNAIADLIIPIVSALSAAHDAGIVHRDLKPENVFLTHAKGGALEPKLVDFGISKLQGEALHLTGTNAILGTPYYMSPEQAGSSKNVDHRSDIFSLGVILYQCVTHELPFKGDSLYQLLGEIMYKDPPQVSALAQGIAPAFEAVIVRAMQKDPAARFQSALELGAALLPFASARVRIVYEPELLAGHAAQAALDGSSTLEPTTTDVTPSRAPRRRMLAGLCALLALAGIALWLRAMHAQPSVAVAAAPSVPVAAPQRPSDEIDRGHARAALATAVPVAVIDAGTQHAGLPSGVAEPVAPPAATSARVTPRVQRGTRRAHDAAPAAARATLAVTPAPAPAAAAEPAAPRVAMPAGDDLFRDRK
jgi:serine/threonine-protein kinase